MIMDDFELSHPRMTAKEKRAYERRERQKLLARKKEKEIDFLIRGSLLFRLPIDEKMINLYEGLKNEDFIGNETKLEHFCVVLGRYLHQSETPFVKIRWKENMQLFRYFGHSLYGKDAAYYTQFFFVNKYGKDFSYPSSDLLRLDSDNKFETLKEIVNKYKNAVCK